MKGNYRTCPICDSINKKTIKHIQMFVPEDFLLPANYNIVCCTDCGAVYNDVPFSDAYNKYYGNYKDITNFTVPSEAKYFLNKIERENRHVKTANFIENNANIDKQSSILDVGCSYGATLLALKDQGYCNLYGVDLDKNSIAYLQQTGMMCRIGSIFSDDLQEFNNKFDLIILGHILEHLHEPKKAINNIQNWLKPNGKIMIECPDLYQYPETSHFPGFFAEYEHINHFSIVSLMNLMLNFELKAFRSDTIYALIENFPCIYAIFGKTETKRELCRTINDEVTMNLSLMESNIQGKTILANIDKLKGKKIAIWGAGQYLYRLLTHTPLNQCNIHYIVDKNSSKWEKKIFGMNITDPQELENFDGTVVICTTTSLSSVVDDIKKMGIHNNIIIPFKKEGVYQ